MCNRSNEFIESVMTIRLNEAFDSKDAYGFNRSKYTIASRDNIGSEGAIGLNEAIGCNETNDPMSHWFQ